MDFISKMKDIFNKKAPKIVSVQKKEIVHPTLEIKTKELREEVEFIILSLDLELLSGIEFIEDIFERSPRPNQVIVRTTMTTIDIKRKIGRFIYQEKRWAEQTKRTEELLTKNMIDLTIFKKVSKIESYKDMFEQINADVFAVCYGNESMTLDETAVAVNSLYIKEYAEKNYSTQHKIESLIDDLFTQSE